MTFLRAVGGREAHPRGWLRVARDRLKGDLLAIALLEEETRFGYVMGQPDCPGETSRDARAVLGKAGVTGPSPA